VLGPDGHAAFLYFAKSCNPAGQQRLYRLLRFWCGLWGRLLSGSWEVHGYIAESLRNFPGEAELDRLLRDHGLVLHARHRLLGGMLQRLQLVRAGEVAVGHR
jgi:demethylmenaquinone methyltransferase/2-methoxy-6-polyprenyl-1,4-benzoquinol methylase